MAQSLSLISTCYVTELNWLLRFVYILLILKDYNNKKFPYTSSPDRRLPDLCSLLLSFSYVTVGSLFYATVFARTSFDPFRDS